MPEFIINNLLSIVVILFLVLSIKNGYELGFFKKLMSIASLIIAIILTRIFTPTVVLLIKDYTNIQSTISNSLENIFVKTDIFDTIDISKFGNIFNIENMNESIHRFISNTVTEGILLAVCGIITFVFFVLALKVIFRLLDFIDFVPVVGTINKILGAFMGFVEGVFIMWLLFIIIRVFSMIPQVKVLEEYIRSAFLINAIYDNNLIYNFFVNLFTPA